MSIKPWHDAQENRKQRQLYTNAVILEATLPAFGIGGLLVGFTLFGADSTRASNVEAAEGIVNV